MCGYSAYTQLCWISIAICTVGEIWVSVCVCVSVTRALNCVHFCNHMFSCFLHLLTTSIYHIVFSFCFVIMTFIVLLVCLLMLFVSRWHALCCMLDRLWSRQLFRADSKSERMLSLFGVYVLVYEYVSCVHQFHCMFVVLHRRCCNKFSQRYTRFSSAYTYIHIVQPHQFQVTYLTLRGQCDANCVVLRVYRRVCIALAASSW